MKKRSASQFTLFNLRGVIGLFLVLAGIFLALQGFGVAQAQVPDYAPTINPLVPAYFDCASIPELGIDKQENFRAGAIMIACGEAEGGSPSPSHAVIQALIPQFTPLLGTSDVDLVTGTETPNHITQSETFSAGNPDNPNQIVVAYNDSRGAPTNYSGASVSTDGGASFTRVTTGTGQSPFVSTLGDPVVLYNRPTATWYTIWLDAGCGSQGLGLYKSTTPSNASSWTHACIHTANNDDRESGWADTNPSSPFYGRMYISWNDFARSGDIFVRYSTDNGLTWTNERQLSTSFFRDVQITGDFSTGAIYVAAMNEGAGGLTTRSNKIYRSTDGGNTWTNSYTGPTFNAPGRGASGSFATMYNNPAYWRHQGWGEPAALNGVVHYVYCSRNTANGDPSDVFYIRSTDGGTTFSAPLMLNTNVDATKAQWQPNLSVTSTGDLLSVWYDERERVAASCQPSSPNTPCYRMWGRRSTDNGVTWLPDEMFSDVVSPLPLQPDGNVQAIYVGDYDYASSFSNQHLHTWADGRVSINNASQQDAFFDHVTAGTPSPTPTATATATATATFTPTPTATATATFTPTVTATATATFTPTATATATFTPTPTASATFTPTATATFTPTATATFTPTATATFTPTATATFTPTATATFTPTATATFTPTATATFTPTATATATFTPTATATATETATATFTPTATATATFTPTATATATETATATFTPTATATFTPTATATFTPTATATFTPTATATFTPTATATATYTPTATATFTPTATATFTPTATPTFTPTATATATFTPTATATFTPTATATFTPTATATFTPTATATFTPTATATFTPTATATATYTPTATATFTPSATATFTPTATATFTPTATATATFTPTATATSTATATATFTPTPTATPTTIPCLSATVSLPTATVSTAVTDFTQSVTTSTLNTSDGLVGFQGDFTFDETVVTFQVNPVSPDGLTASNWNVSGQVLEGGGPIRTLRISAYSNNFTPLSGSGVLFDLNMTRVSSTPGANTPLTWAAPPADFFFIDTNLDPHSPCNTPSGSITIVAATFNISGTITYCSNPSLSPVPGVTLTLSGDASGSTSSDGSGNYTLSAVLAGGNYTVTPSKAALAPGSTGINTVDVVAIQRHYLHVGTPLSGCRLTAGDANGDTVVDTIDVVATQRFFLALSTGIGNVGKYKFNPLNRSYSGTTTDQSGQNYSALIVGDVASPFVH